MTNPVLLNIRELYLDFIGEKVQETVFVWVPGNSGVSGNSTKDFSVMGAPQ